MITLLVGYIGSGKSTYARGLCRGGALCVNHDRIIEHCHQEYRYEEGLHGVYHAMEDALAGIVLDAGRDLVVDRTHLTRKSRARWVEFGRARGVPVKAVVFPAEDPEVHAIRRFQADPRGFTLEKWARIARHHQEKAEPVGESEGFASVESLEPGWLWQAVVEKW